jgi:RNA polymerase sigma-70 factor (ECF subfamily)
MAAMSQEAIQAPVALPAAVDDQLVRRCQADDQAAFRQVVESYGDVLFGTALMMTGDRQLAEDLTQDAFVQVWRRIETFRAGSPLKPWLIRILVNRTTSHKRRRFLALVPMPFAERTRDADPGPETVVELDEQRAELRTALGRLPDDQRRMVVLRFYAEMSVPEIADATGTPEGTVKSRLSRATARLRELLAEPDRNDES